MRVAVFGATGGTGRLVVRQALDRGHWVRALARRPEALEYRDPRLEIFGGDVLRDGSCAPVVDGADVVVSAIGPGESLRATTIYSQGTDNIIQAMGEAGVSRLVCVSSSGPYIRQDSGARPVFRMLLPVLCAKPYADMRRMEEEIRSSGLDWVVIRATRLTNGERTGRYRVCAQQTPPGGWRISRADLAGFILHLMETDEYLRTTPVVAY